MLLIPRQEVNTILAMLAALAAVNIALLIYGDMTASPNILGGNNVTIIHDINTAFVAMKLRIAVALVLGALLLGLRNMYGLAGSSLALLWALLEFILWYLTTFRGINNAENLNYSMIPHTGFLSNANWWDISVLVIVSVGLLWEVKIMTKVYRRSLH